MKNKKINLIISIILMVSFLIEYPLRSALTNIFLYFPILTFLPNVVFYIAIFVSMLLIEKYYEKMNFLKTAILVLVILVVFMVSRLCSFGLLFALVAEILKTIISAIVLFFGLKWLLKRKANPNKFSILFIVISTLANIVFNILEYKRIASLVVNVGNELFSYLILITPSISVYNILAGFAFYIIVFFAFYLFIRDGKQKTETP